MNVEDKQTESSSIVHKMMLKFILVDIFNTPIDTDLLHIYC